MARFEMAYYARFTAAAESRFKVLTEWLALREEGYAGAVLMATEWNEIMRERGFYLLKSWTTLSLMEVAGQEEYTYTKETKDGPVESVGTRRLYRLAERIPVGNGMLWQVLNEAGLKPAGDIWENDGAKWRDASRSKTERDLARAKEDYNRAVARALEEQRTREQDYEAVGKVMNAVRPLIDWGSDKP